MDHLNKDSLDLTKENIKKLKELFPQIVIEEKIDFEKLKLILGEEIDERNEKFQFSWNGKNNAIKISQTPSINTLVPLKGKSINWENTENLYIEGDNLEVLKLLQKTYFGKIKLIYIDPPYNTGNDFVYNDSFSDSIENYKKITKQSLHSNPETSGKYHTNWLNMMYPRLILAKNLLSNDGAIFISIDDNEQANLKKICDEIFGESNFVNTIALEITPSSGVKRAHKDKMYIKNTEYILVYRKSDNFKIEPLYDVWNTYDKHYSIYFDGKEYTTLANKIKLLNSTYSNVKLEHYMYFQPIKDFILSNSNKIYRTHDASKWAVENVVNAELIYNSERKIYKSFNVNNPDEYELLIEIEANKFNRLEPLSWNLVDGEIKTLRGNLWLDFDKDMGNVSKEGEIPYPNGKKPLRLLTDIIQSITSENDIILDFFSGSATTGHAVYQINRLQNTNRKFILIQLPEVIDYTKGDNKKNYSKYGFETICDLGQKRLSIAIEKQNNNMTLFNDVIEGFKVFKLESTNIKPWDGSYKVDENTIFNFIDTIKEDRTNLDVAYEIMLKYGIFNMPLKGIQINNKTMYNIGDGYMIICLDNDITSKDVMEIANHKPHCVVFKEQGFADDNEKINATYTLERLGVEDVKCI